MENNEQVPEPVRKAIKGAYEKHREGLLTKEQLNIVIRMLQVMALIATELRNSNNLNKI